MGKYKKIQSSLLIILIVAIGTFSYLMYSWNFARTIGKLTTDDGTYIGEFKGKMFDGEGTFAFSTGIKYKGHWSDGKIEGFGVLTFADGSKYEGEFKNGLYNGEGKITQADGTVIKGIWENGKLKERK